MPYATHEKERNNSSGYVGESSLQQHDFVVLRNHCNAIIMKFKTWISTHFSFSIDAKLIHTHPPAATSQPSRKTHDSEIQLFLGTYGFTAYDVRAQWLAYPR